MRSRFDRVVTLPTDERVVGGAALLLEGDGRWQPVDGVHLRDAELVEQPAGVRGDGLQVAALGLGVQGAEGQRRLARPRHAGEHHQGVAGDIDVNVLQVMGSGSANGDEPREPDMGGRAGTGFHDRSHGSGSAAGGHPAVPVIL
jgi:hypothetical protein